MMALSDKLQERESEFTGLKGELLRYTGCAYALVIASQFIEALAMRGGAASGVLYRCSAAVFVFAFVAYPLYAKVLRRDARA